jgi:hypothetical protein
MTNFLGKPQAGNIAKFSGKIACYRCTRASGDLRYPTPDVRPERRKGVKNGADLP